MKLQCLRSLPGLFVVAFLVLAGCLGPQVALAVDCNGNGIPDDEDIASGTSLDCQPDGIPDECQLAADALIFAEGFESFSQMLLDGWVGTNHSNPIGETEWHQGDSSFDAHEGPATAYAEADYKSAGIPGSGTATISDWLITPVFDLQDGQRLSFFTRTFISSSFPNRMQVRMSVEGSSTDIGTGEFDVGDFTTLLVDINPTLQVGGYPNGWQEFAIELSGIGEPTTGRFAFRYFVTDGGPAGSNSSAIALDTFKLQHPVGKFDCDGSGVPDGCEMASGVLDDCDENGLPDVCEFLDCNLNEIHDPCDLLDCDGSPWCSDCNGNGIPDDCDIADSTSEDCNDNDIPDGCDIADLTSADCNTNRIPDECDIASGTSEDCLADGTPDECEVRDGPWSVYAIDDGTAESQAGLYSGGHIVFLNHFVVQPGQGKIIGIALPWGQGTVGAAADLYLWSDPNGDGDPIDAEVIVTASTTLQNLSTSIFNFVDLPDREAPAGTSFFVGGIVTHPAQVYPAARDTGSTSDKSWLGANNWSDGPIDPDNIGDVAGHLTLLSWWGLPGNFMVRPVMEGAPGDCNDSATLDVCDLITGTSHDCNANAQPDECDIASGFSDDDNGNGVPNECQADMNCDGDVNGLDIQGFVLAIVDPGLYESIFSECNILHGDMDGNDDVEMADLPQFIDALLLGS